MSVAGFLEGDITIVEYKYISHQKPLVINVTGSCKDYGPTQVLGPHPGRQLIAIWSPTANIPNLHCVLLATTPAIHFT